MVEKMPAGVADLEVPSGPTWPASKQAQIQANVTTSLVGTYEERLMRAARSPQNWDKVLIPGPEHYTSCRVLVMVGDSNMKRIFNMMWPLFNRAGHKLHFKYPTGEQEKLPCNPNAPNETCDARWSDRTFIFGAPGNTKQCTVALLFRFVHNQGALNRVIDKPFDTVFCSALTSLKGQASPERFGASYSQTHSHFGPNIRSPAVSSLALLPNHFVQPKNGTLPSATFFARLVRNDCVASVVAAQTAWAYDHTYPTTF